MAEYINRGDLTIWLNKKSCEYSMNDVVPIGWTLKGLINELATFPSADVVERKTGKWMTTDAFPHHVYCSACHKTYIPNDNWQIWQDHCNDGGLPRNYCPNCGAKMEAELPKENPE